MWVLAIPKGTVELQMPTSFQMISVIDQAHHNMSSWRCTVRGIHMAWQTWRTSDSPVERNHTMALIHFRWADVSNKFWRLTEPSTGDFEKQSDLQEAGFSGFDCVVPKECHTRLLPCSMEGANGMVHTHWTITNATKLHQVDKLSQCSQLATITWENAIPWHPNAKEIILIWCDSTQPMDVCLWKQSHEVCSVHFTRSHSWLASCWGGNGHGFAHEAFFFSCVIVRLWPIPCPY